MLLRMSIALAPASHPDFFLLNSQLIDLSEDWMLKGICGGEASTFCYVQTRRSLLRMGHGRSGSFGVLETFACILGTITHVREYLFLGHVPLVR